MNSHLKSILIDITDILRENKDLTNEIKTINESILKNNDFFLNEIKDKNNEIKSLKNEVKEINELFLIQNKELKNYGTSNRLCFSESGFFSI